MRSLRQEVPPGFNPTLVRLRQGGIGGRNDPEVCFNPTLVRLRPLSSGSGYGWSVSFQSHAGSIEALRFQVVRGRRERATLSCIRFTMNITQDALVVKGFGFLHAPEDEGGSAEAFSEERHLAHLNISFRA